MIPIDFRTRSKTNKMKCKNVNLRAFLKKRKCIHTLRLVLHNEVCFTFISKHSNSNGQERTQHIEQSYGGLQCPFILAFSALGALLDPCEKREKTLFSPFYCHSSKSKEEMGYNSVFLWGLFMSRSPTSGQTALESTLKQFP